MLSFLPSIHSSVDIVIFLPSIHSSMDIVICVLYFRIHFEKEHATAGSEGFILTPSNI